MSRVRVRVAAEQVARGAVEVQVDWKGDAADVDSAPALKSAIARSASFKTLHVRVTGGAGEAAQRLAEVLLDMTTLGISHNQITDAGAIALAQAVEESTSMTSLTLHENQITDAGVIALASAVGKSRSIVMLNLIFNGITQVGAIALAYAVERSWRLTRLGLSGDNIEMMVAALDRATTNRQLLALLSALVPGRANANIPAATLVWGDGDHAVAHRVLHFMLEMSPAEVEE